MTHTVHITITTRRAEVPDSRTVPPVAAAPAPEPHGTARRRPAKMGRRARYSFDIDLTRADIEDDLSYGRD